MFRREVLVVFTQGQRLASLNETLGAIGVALEIHGRLSSSAPCRPVKGTDEDAVCQDIAKPARRRGGPWTGARNPCRQEDIVRASTRKRGTGTRRRVPDRRKLYDNPSWVAHCAARKINGPEDALPGQRVRTRHRPKSPKAGPSRLVLPCSPSPRGEGLPRTASCNDAKRSGGGGGRGNAKSMIHVVTQSGITSNFGDYRLRVAAAHPPGSSPHP